MVVAPLFKKPMYILISGFIILSTPIFAPLLKGIEMYQGFISSRQGDLCNFTPSCSEFAYKAIDEKGLLGIIMTFDRLERCNFKCWSYANNYYDVVYVKGRGYKLYDPVNKQQILPPVGVKRSVRVSSFADYLYEKGEWESSILEYERELRKYDTEKIYMRIGSAYWMMGERERARYYLNRVDNDTSRLFVGITWLEERNVDSAFCYLQSINRFREEVNGFLYNLNNISRKNPVAAGLLSSILPGSGRIYSGCIWDGIFSFLFISGSLSISYLYNREKRPVPSYTFLSLGFLLYIGDIYGSIKSATNYNEKYYDDLVIVFRDNFDEFF